jgi:uncharacterized protein
MDASKTTIKVKITPRANHNECTGKMEDGTIKIKLCAPPVDGKANSALLQFIAEKMNLSKADIKIISGQTSHIKLVTIEGATQEDVDQKLIA